jgi:hypothetical protein
VLDDGAAKAAVKEAAFRWRTGEPNLTWPGRGSICCLGCL